MALDYGSTNPYFRPATATLAAWPVPAQSAAGRKQQDEHGNCDALRTKAIAAQPTSSSIRTQQTVSDNTAVTDDCRSVDIRRHQRQPVLWPPSLVRMSLARLTT